MKDAQELLSVHLCSFLAPVALLLLNALLPGGVVGSPYVVFSVLSLLLTLVALVAPFLFLCPLHLQFSPVKPFRHYVQLKHQKKQIVLLTKSSFAQALAGSVLLYIVVGILLGADPFRQFLATLVWSVLMTSLTCVPTVVLLDVDWDRCVQVLLHRVFVNSAERGLYIMFMSTLLGAWLGAVPIPLDWNRPWQVWPIPCSCGALAGSLVGSGYSLLAQHYSLYPAQLSLCHHGHHKV